MHKLSNGNVVRFAHIRDKQQPRGGVCYAVEVNAADEVIAFAVAVCHPRDNYCRRIGRAIALGRLAINESRTETPHVKWEYAYKLLTLATEYEARVRAGEDVDIDAYLSAISDVRTAH